MELNGTENVAVTASNKADPVEMANKLQLVIEEFWRDITTWKAMNPSSRENFLQDVYPTIVKSLSDRYCIINGEKKYEHRYDTLLQLTTIVTVESMMSGNNLMDSFIHGQMS